MAENQERVSLALKTSSEPLVLSNSSQICNSENGGSPHKKTARFDQINGGTRLNYYHRQRNPLQTWNNTTGGVPNKFNQESLGVNGWTSIFSDQRHNDSSMLDDSGWHSQISKSVTSEGDEMEQRGEKKASFSEISATMNRNQQASVYFEHYPSLVRNDSICHPPTNIWQPRMSAASFIYKTDSFNSFQDKSVMSPMGMDDIPMMYQSVSRAPEYADEIVQYLLKREDDIRIRISRSYMSKQTELTSVHRWIVMDWLVEVVDEFNLDQQTLHLAARYVDRFLSLMDVPNAKIQLVGTTSLMIAAKLEEIYPPELRKFVFVTNDSYSKYQVGHLNFRSHIEMVKRMEVLILNTLKFHVSLPTAVWFASQFLNVLKAPQRTIHLTNYLCDLALMKLELSAVKASLVGASAVCLANLMTDVSIPWPGNLERLTGYSSSILLEIVQELNELLRTAPSPPNAVYQRYSKEKCLSVASIGFPDAASLTVAMVSNMRPF